VCGQKKRPDGNRSRHKTMKYYKNEIYPPFGIYLEDYRREKRALDDKPATLVVPGVDAAMEAGKLLENLPVLWEEADLAERRNLLMAMRQRFFNY